MKVYVNIAPTLLYGGNSGIQRVVRELRRHLDGRKIGQVDYEFGGFIGARWSPAAKIKEIPRAVLVQSSRLRGWLRFLVPQKLRLARRRVLVRLGTLGRLGQVLPRGSVVVDIDAGWIDDWHRNYTLDVYRISLVYDLIPLSYPQHCTEAHSKGFARWLSAALATSDGVISISRSAMDSVREFAEHAPNTRVRHYAYFHLGCDFSAQEQANRSLEIPEGLRTRRYFLIVGTIEPRKNHKTLFAAFEKYRKSGGQWDLAVVGREGWNCANIVAAMRGSPWFGDGLQWFDNADDTLLAALYKGAGALVIPSEVEGFGLPLVEGVHWKIPVIASDIPVFREVGESFANFFPAHSESALLSLLQRAEMGEIKNAVSDSSEVGISWDRSAEQFSTAVESMINKVEPTL